MHDTYENPLITRYASREMARLFGDDKKFVTWRKLWIALAEAEAELGLPITTEQLDELRAHAQDIPYDAAARYEAKVRHDVMAHVHAYGEQCPLARPIIHLGATSCYVTDNTDIIVMREALALLKDKLVNCIRLGARFAQAYRALPTLGFTHFQPAQLTTVGKRACLWLQDLVMDYDTLTWQMSQMRLRGVKGTTGTQASFLTLFGGDHDKVCRLEELVTQKMGFSEVFAVTGQTYSRKLDTQVMHVLTGLAESAAKFSNDIRLLQHLKEIEEPFEKDQIGSSAMAYKRNPMRSERMAALARFIIANASNTAMTSAAQWFERTLDDSANRRLVIPQAFLAADAALNLYMNVMGALVVYPGVIEKHIGEELPFMATETILMEAVKRGGDRQSLHEKIRVYAQEAARRVKQEGAKNDLLQAIAGDEAFALTAAEIEAMLSAHHFTGRAPEQVDAFLATEVARVLGENTDVRMQGGDVRV